MANHRESPRARKRLRLPASRGITKQPESTCKAKVDGVRRSARLYKISQLEQGRIKRQETEPLLSSLAELSQDRARPQTFDKSKDPSLKRKRRQEVHQPSPLTQGSPSSECYQKSVQIATEGKLQEAGGNIGTNIADPLESWVVNESWPSEYFIQDDQVRKSFLKHDSWLEERMEQPPPPIVQYVEINGFTYPRPIQKASASLRRKQSDSSLTGTSDQKRRESKSVSYRDIRYVALLAAKGSRMEKSDLGITNASLSSYKALLSLDQTVPNDSLFRDDVFEATCRSVEDRNEARVIRSILPYIVPSAEDWAIMGNSKLKCLIENVNDAWTGSIPVEGPRPQPDYSVGFRRTAFTEEQLNKLDPLVGSVFDTSYFVAIYRMYFSFLTCEVKCGAAALDVADRQNAHSMTIAVRSVVELYRAVKREKDLNREILAFSVSHDHRLVRMYGHYVVIDDSKVIYYRHPIKTFDFTSEEGADKWTAYKFIKNVYDVWMPTHLERICSAIDQLPPSLDFEVFQRLGVQSTEATRLPQDRDSPVLELSTVDIASQICQGDDDLNQIVPQAVTPDTSVSRGEDQGVAKRAKKNRTTK